MAAAGAEGPAGPRASPMSDPATRGHLVGIGWLPAVLKALASAGSQSERVHGNFPSLARAFDRAIVEWPPG